MGLEPEGKQNEPPVQPPEITLAKWSTRFWAWLVDVIIVNAALGVLFGILSMPMWLYGFTNPRMMLPIYGTDWWGGFWGPLSFGINSLVSFIYWTYMESRHNGQSIGKMLLHIKTADLQGKQPETKDVAISSFGKSFLLIIDVFFGWIFTNEKRQRLLSRAANTIVIRVKDEPGSGMNISYRKD